MTKGKVDVVLGAGGGCGKLCVERLLQQGGQVRAVGRDPEKLKALFGEPPNLSYAAADVEDPDTVKEALRGCRGVIFAASGKGYFSAAKVDNQGVANVSAAAKQAGAHRVVLISSCLVTKKHRYHPMRIILNNIKWSLMDEKLKGEEALRASGVPYTIVRPGGLTDQPGGKAKLTWSQGDLPARGPGTVSRADVAAVCCAAILAKDAKNTTLEIVATAADDVDPDQLNTFFAGLSTEKFDEMK